jgi:hypothetical protein
LKEKNGSDRDTPTPEEVWAYLMETDRQMKESAARTDRQIAEYSAAAAKTDRQMKESAARTDRLIAEYSAAAAKTDRLMKESAARTERLIAELTAKTDKQIAETSEEVKKLSVNVGGINNMIGDIAEGLLTSDLFEKFNALGYDFDDAISNCTIREKGTKRLLAELDMLMLNGSIALAIEAKARMTIKDVEQHLRHMAILHKHPNNLLNGRTLYGAMAGVKMTNRSKIYALNKGFFVIEPSGESVTIEPPRLKPAIW